MEKRNYTHVQVRLPEIKAMLAEGGEHSGKLQNTLTCCLKSAGAGNGSRYTSVGVQLK